MSGVPVWAKLTVSIEQNSGQPMLADPVFYILTRMPGTSFNNGFLDGARRVKNPTLNVHID